MKRQPEYREIPIEWKGMDDLPGVPPHLQIPATIAIEACASAVTGGIREMMQAGQDGFTAYREGKIDEAEYTHQVVSKGTTAALKQGARTAAALTLSEGAKQVIARRWGQAVLRRLTRYNVVGAVAFGLIDQGTDTYRLVRGDLPLRDYKIKSVENVGGTGGAISGAAAGAILGSVVPGLGTGMGAMVGYMMGVLGAMGGASLGRSIGEHLFGDEAKPGADSGPAPEA